MCCEQHLAGASLRVFVLMGLLANKIFLFSYILYAVPAFQLYVTWETTSWVIQQLLFGLPVIKFIIFFSYICVRVYIYSKQVWEYGFYMYNKDDVDDFYEITERFLMFYYIGSWHWMYKILKRVGTWLLFLFYIFWRRIRLNYLILKTPKRLLLPFYVVFRVSVIWAAEYLYEDYIEYNWNEDHQYNYDVKPYPDQPEYYYAVVWFKEIGFMGYDASVYSFRNIMSYNMPESILFIFRKRVNLILCYVILFIFYLPVLV